MIRQIKKQARVFVAILFLFVVALGIGGYILSNQRFYLPAWVPLVGTDFYTVKAELPTAQAVVPGQGQTVNVAGVKIGEVGTVNLEDGKAVVDLQIKEQYKPIYRDSTILLRPKTGLKDMYLALDPGTRSAGELPEGGRVRVANTLPDVNADEFLAQLDTDTRAYLQILLNAGGTTFDDKVTGAEARYDQTAAQDLREVFKRFEPTARDGEKITRLLIARRQNIRHVIHNFQEFSTALAARDRAARSARGLRQRELRDLRVRGGLAARGAAALPRRARPDRADTAQDQLAGGRARPGARAPAPVRPQPGAGAAQDARRSSTRPRRSSATRSGRSPATCSRRSATCAPPRTTSRS